MVAALDLDAPCARRRPVGGAAGLRARRGEPVLPYGAVRQDRDMTPADPVNLTSALASFDQVYSPRIVARVNDYDVRVAHARGEHVWHVHADTDEFFLVLDGEFTVALRDPTGAETAVVLHQGDTFVVPKGTEHKPSSTGAAVLMFEPNGTVSTGDRHDGDIPAHVDSTTGHSLA